MALNSLQSVAIANSGTGVPPVSFKVAALVHGRGPRIGVRLCPSVVKVRFNCIVPG